MSEPLKSPTQESVQLDILQAILPDLLALLSKVLTAIARRK